MKNEPNSLRAHLLNVEPVDENRRQCLEQEIRALSDNHLQPRHRKWWILSLAASILFAGNGAFLAIFANMDISLNVIWWLYSLANVLWALYSFHILRTNRFDRRQYGRFVAMIPAACLAITIILFCRAAFSPTNENLLWAAFGVMCMLLNLAMILYGRIVGAEWSAKESALRMELLLIDIRDRGKTG
jgi:hypothetical protein